MKAHGKLAWSRTWCQRWSWKATWRARYWSAYIPGPVRCVLRIGPWSIYIPRWGIAPEAKL